MSARSICLAVAIGLLVASAGHADDYKPVNCPSALPYKGAALPALKLAPVLTQLTQAPPFPAATFSSEQSRALEAAFETAKSRVKVGAMTAAISSNAGQWSHTTPGAETQSLFWASAGKTFTAVAILQMAEEGKLRLDDPIETYVKGVPNGKAITLRHLLTHTSGLFSSNEDLKVRQKPGPMTLEADVAVLNKHGAMFCPGENWRYSNSGYHLLGAMLEKVDGKPYAQIIQTRIIDRLGVKTMRALTPADALAGVVMPVSFTSEPAIDPREPGPAGAIVASAPDMIVFWQALLNARLLKAQTVQAMFAELWPMFGQPPFYGEGVMVYALPDPSSKVPRLWLGHSGGAPGVKAVVAYSPDKDAYVAVSIAGEGSAEATANLLLSQLK